MAYFGSSWGEEWYGSKQNETIKQYFIYGILKPYSWYQEWEKQTGKNFQEFFADYMNDDVDTDDISCLFDGRDGKFIIIGKIIERTANDSPYMGNGKPLVIPELSELEKYQIEKRIKKNFDIEGIFYYYFVTQRR